jgi:hypothetical protein
MLRSRLIDNIVESKFEHFQNHTIVKNKIDYDSLSLNPNITWDVVINNTDKPWNWYCLNNNPNITWDIVINNPDKPSLG